MIQFSNIPKSAADKDLLLTVGMFMVRASIRSRREGVAALKEQLVDDGALTDEHNARPFSGETEWVLRTLISMLVDGHGEEFIASAARYSVETSNAQGGKLLALMVGAEGVASIRRGDNPHVLVRLLASMMGWNIGSEFTAAAEAFVQEEERLSAARHGEENLPDDVRARIAEVNSFFEQKMVEFSARVSEVHEKIPSREVIGTLLFPKPAPEGTDAAQKPPVERPVCIISIPNAPAEEPRQDYSLGAIGADGGVPVSKEMFLFYTRWFAGYPDVFMAETDGLAASGWDRLHTEITVKE